MVGKLHHFFPSEGGDTLLSGVNDRRVDELRVPFHRIEFIAIVCRASCADIPEKTHCSFIQLH